MGNLLLKINVEALGRTRDAWGGNVPALRTRLAVLLHQQLTEWPWGTPDSNSTRGGRAEGALMKTGEHGGESCV